LGRSLKYGKLKSSRDGDYQYAELFYWSSNDKMFFKSFKKFLIKISSKHERN
jgi:hypothetical protein